MFRGSFFETLLDSPKVAQLFSDDPRPVFQVEMNVSGDI